MAQCILGADTPVRVQLHHPLQQVNQLHQLAAVRGLACQQCGKVLFDGGVGDKAAHLWVGCERERQEWQGEQQNQDQESSTEPYRPFSQCTNEAMMFPRQTPPTHAATLDAGCSPASW